MEIVFMEFFGAPLFDGLLDCPGAEGESEMLPQGSEFRIQVSESQEKLFPS
jgi:hypothetical protein